MNNTALSAGANMAQNNIIFISDAHEKFYYKKLKEVRHQDVYYKALCYCLGIRTIPEEILKAFMILRQAA